VEGVPGGSLNYPELVVYNEEAALPKCVVFYTYNEHADEYKNDNGYDRYDEYDDENDRYEYDYG
jgi:hypothetical protein